MKAVTLLLIAAFIILSGCEQKTQEEPVMEEKQGIYRFTMQDIQGNPKPLSDYKGRVLLVVNVASKCGYTPQYEGLQTLFEKYRDQGFMILGFPANNFGGQEPGTDEEILEFCRMNYGVEFDMFSKISVAGDDIHPLYRYLTQNEENREFHGPITWNFNKFLIDSEGRVVRRYPSDPKPNDPKLIQDIEAMLNDQNEGQKS